MSKEPNSWFPEATAKVLKQVRAHLGLGPHPFINQGCAISLILINHPRWPVHQSGFPVRFQGAFLPKTPRETLSKPSKPQPPPPPPGHFPVLAGHLDLPVLRICRWRLGGLRSIRRDHTRNDPGRRLGFGFPKRNS